ncbi:MAG: hypothetical protein SFV54_12490 [Bryobacteraceae bacterium]|nr:hypothetical protein [Bryobacteraceae bacterium]
MTWKRLAFVFALAAAALPAQTLKLTPGSLTFSYQLGDAKLPAAQTLAASVTGSTTPLNFTVAATGGAWLTVSPDAGRTPGSLKVTVNPTSLAIGNYSGQVTVTPTSGTAINVPVSLTVKAAPAALSVTPNPVSLVYTPGSPAPSQKLTLNSNGSLLSYTAAVTGATWLTATPTSGIIFPGFTPTVDLIVSPTGLAPGAYKGTVTVSAAASANKSVAITVNLTVNPGAPTLTGVFPASAVVGTGATTVTLTGTNFYSGSQVRVNGSTPLATTPLGSTSMQAVIPASLLSAVADLAITVSNPDPGGGLSSAATFKVLAPGPQIAGVVDASSYVLGPVSPGKMVAVFGTGLGPASLTTFAVPTPPATIAGSLAGTRILFGTTTSGAATAAPIIFTSQNQVVAMVPYDVTVGGTVKVWAEYNTVVSAQPVTLSVAGTGPGLFTVGSTGSGQAAALNEDGTINSDSNPIAGGKVISLFGTGEGLLTATPAVASGEILSSVLNIAAAVTAQIDGIDAPVQSATGVSGLVAGVFQVNLTVPAGAKAGKTVPVFITIGGVTTQAGVTISVK